MYKIWFVSLLLISVSSTALAQTQLAAITEQGENAAAHIALVGETVEVTIDQQFARTRLHQVFENRSQQRLEGRYQIQVGEGARVDGFAYWNGEQKIVGEVFEKQTATEVYEQVTGLGRDPGLLEQQGEGAFSFRLFPIEPGERKPVEVYYGRWLRREGDTVTYRVPLEHAHSTVVVRIADERGIAQVTSSTHDIQVDQIAHQQVVVRADGVGKGNELSLRYRVRAADWSVAAFVHRDAGHAAYLMATVATPSGLARGTVADKDITLVLDRSGSMSGQPLVRAKQAAKAVIKRLGAADRINVIDFDDDVDQLFQRPQPLSSAVRRQALAYVDGMNEGGGTNLALALERALAAQAPVDAADESRPHIILFLTDGQSDAQATLQVAQADTGDARVFTIGVGSGVQKPLLARLAATKRGRFTFIHSPQDIESKVSRLYDQIAAPVLVGVSVDVQGAGQGAGRGDVRGARLSRTYPRTLPDLYRGDELLITSRLTGKGPMTVTVRGELAGKPVAFTRRVTVADTVKRPWVGRLWAQARVQDLLEEIALYGETEELTNEVVNLAVAYNFVSPYTSFLAIPESELTQDARDTLAAARQRKQRILAAHKDAVALSRSAMPPGDPILKVRAPAAARQVTAYFPFGLVKDLVYDADTEHWRVRFLVPKHVVDGSYTVKIVIVHADNTVEIAQVPYTIDSNAADFAVDMQPTGAGVRIQVTTSEVSRLVTAALVGHGNQRVELRDQGDGLHFTGLLPLAVGAHQVRVVVADAARNEADQVVSIVVPAGMTSAGPAAASDTTSAALPNAEIDAKPNAKPNAKIDAKPNAKPNAKPAAKLAAQPAAKLAVQPE